MYVIIGITKHKSAQTLAWGIATRADADVLAKDFVKARPILKSAMVVPQVEYERLAAMGVCPTFESLKGQPVASVAELDAITQTPTEGTAT